MIVQSEEIDYCGIIILLRQLVQAGKWEKMIPHIAYLFHGSKKINPQLHQFRLTAGNAYTNRHNGNQSARSE